MGGEFRRALKGGDHAGSQNRHPARLGIGEKVSWLSRCSRFAGGSGGQSTRQPSAILGVTRARFAAVAQRIENGLRFGQDMIQPYEADPD